MLEPFALDYERLGVKRTLLQFGVCVPIYDELYSVEALSPCRWKRLSISLVKQYLCTSLLGLHFLCGEFKG